MLLAIALVLPWAIACGSSAAARATPVTTALVGTAPAQISMPEESPMPERPSELPKQPQPTSPATSAQPVFQATPLAPRRTGVTQAPATAGAVAPTTLDPALAQAVEAARADLAQRRSIASASISVVEVREVTWPDPGLGCPRPGVAYKQVPVDGLLIRLKAEGRMFEYHSGGTKTPSLCE
jgi:hypothetical protein